MRDTGKILTANRLNDGLVVFLSAANTWTRDVNNAALASEENAQAALVQRGEDYEAANHITGAYLVSAEREDGAILPNHIRERIRAAGPSVHTGLITENTHVSL